MQAQDREQAAREAEEAEAEAKGRAAIAARAEAKQDELDAIALRVVKSRDELPKDLDAACTELIENYSDWVKSVYFDQDGFQLDFFDHRKANLGKIKGGCARMGDVEAAVCMVEVIKGVTADGAFTETERKMIQEHPKFLFDACVAKFAPDTP